jgi:hypothetical protein
LEEKEMRFIIHQMRKTTWRVNLSKHSHPTFERKCQPFKGEFRGSACVTKCASTMADALVLQASSATSMKLYVLADMFTTLAVRKQ